MSQVIVVLGKSGSGKSSVASGITGINAPSEHVLVSEGHTELLQRTLLKPIPANICELFGVIRKTNTTIWFDSDQLSLFDPNGKPIQNEPMLIALTLCAISSGFKLIVVSRMSVSDNFYKTVQNSPNTTVRTIGLSVSPKVQEARVSLRVSGAIVPFSSIQKDNINLLESQQKWTPKFPQGSLELNSEIYPIEEIVRRSLHFIEHRLVLSASGNGNNASAGGVEPRAGPLISFREEDNPEGKEPSYGGFVFETSIGKLLFSVLPETKLTLKDGDMHITDFFGSLLPEQKNKVMKLQGVELECAFSSVFYNEYGACAVPDLTDADKLKFAKKTDGFHVTLAFTGEKLSKEHLKELKEKPKLQDFFKALKFPLTKAVANYANCIPEVGQKISFPPIIGKAKYALFFN